MSYGPISLCRAKTGLIYESLPYPKDSMFYTRDNKIPTKFLLINFRVREAPSNQAEINLQMPSAKKPGVFFTILFFSDSP